MNQERRPAERRDSRKKEEREGEESSEDRQVQGRQGGRRERQRGHLWVESHSEEGTTGRLFLFLCKCSLQPEHVLDVLELRWRFKGGAAQSSQF